MPEQLSAEARAARWKQQAQLTETAGNQTKDAHGSSDWLSPDEAAAAGLHEGLLLMGRDPGGLLWYGGEGHCLTFAPTGSGKSVSVVVPNLLTYPGSVVCVDPKGAIASITARRRRAMGQKVILLDPFGEVERAQKQGGAAADWPALLCDSYNPLGHLRPESFDEPGSDLIDDVREVAASLIVSESGKERYFSDSARSVAECLILYLLWKRAPEHRTIETLLDIAFSSHEEIYDGFLPEMRESDVFDGHLQHLANQVLGFSKEGGPAIWSTLRRSLQFLMTPKLKAVTEPSEIDFSRLKTEPTTVYLVLPAKRLTTHGAWLRLMLAVILSQISDARQPKHPVLFLLDECAALQRLEILETAVGLMRGYGMKLWLIFQDLSQMKRLYEESWSTFISNSGARQFFNVNDTETADYVSQYIGNTTREVMSQNVQPNQAANTASLSVVSRPLITPDEVRRIGKQGQILLYEGLKPCLSDKLAYFRDSEFAGAFDSDPYIAQEK